LAIEIVFHFRVFYRDRSAGQAADAMPMPK
jgi:hypothetical protein